MVEPSADPSKYRPAAGVAIFNPAGQIWLGRRKGQAGRYRWQLPQGGIDAGETGRDAALREMYEETGITADKVEVIGQVADELFYDFPKDILNLPRLIQWRGQRQSWIAVRFFGTKDDIDLKAHPPQEFSTWKWADLHDIPKLIIPFKRNVYERLVSEFEGFAKPTE